MIQSVLIETLPVIERFSRTAPLGLRFWDEVSGKVIADGLSVTAYPPDNPERRIEAFTNHVGVFVLTGLPGLRDVEFGDGDEGFWSSPPASVTFNVEVVDAERRFQPFLLTLDAPVKGIVDWSDSLQDSPPSTNRGIPLYSTASRSIPSGMAAVRAELHEWQASGDHDGGPARWAVVEARLGRELLARGMADDKGRVALIFAYPEPVTHVLGSPPGAGSSPPGAQGPSLRDQQWLIGLSAFYSRLSPAPAIVGGPTIPELTEVLSQTAATVWEDSERGRALSESVLSFGQELIVRSTDAITNKPKSVLFISPAGSPP